MSIAYALRAEFDGTVDQDGSQVPVFTGGTVTHSDGRTFDVREALDAGDGVIVVAEDNTELVIALDGFLALKRVDAPAGADPVSSYELQTIADLRAEAKRRGLTGVGNTSKAVLIHALVKHDQRLAAGDETAEASPANDVTVDELADDNDQSTEA